jgi:hypothetical protein
VLQRIPCQDHDAISSHHARQNGHNNKDACVLTGPGHQYKGGHEALPLNVRKQAEERMAAAAILEKVDRIGEIDVLEGLRDTISELRTGADEDGLCSHEGINQIIPNHLENQPASTQKLWLLKEELNLNELDKQIHRFRKRLGLAEFFNTYIVCALRYVETKRTAAIKQVAKNLRRRRDMKTNPGARNSHPDRSVLSHFVDLLFPNTTISGKGKRVGRKKGELTRGAATRKIQNWRKTGKLWGHLIARFGKGILLLMPKEISDEE